jgi:hypothetical protein
LSPRRTSPASRSAACSRARAIGAGRTCERGSITARCAKSLARRERGSMGGGLGAPDPVASAHDHVYARFAPMDPTGAPDPTGIRESRSGPRGARERDVPWLALDTLSAHSASLRDWSRVSRRTPMAPRLQPGSLSTQGGFVPLHGT